MMTVTLLKTHLFPAKQLPQLKFGKAKTNLKEELNVKI